MAKGPALNPDLDNIADRAKHAYAMGTEQLAAVQYRLAELAGTDRLDRDESMDLQQKLYDVWSALYAGTLCAVRDEDSDDGTWDVDNTFSDGRPVLTKIRIHDEESSDVHWEHNRFLLGDGAVNEFPRGLIWVTSPVDPADAYTINDPRRQPDSGEAGRGDGGRSGNLTPLREKLLRHP